MRVIKAIVLFCFSMAMVSACFEAPEVSVIPRIFFRDIEFREIGTIADNDSLIIRFDFQDGDGDLGLRQDVPQDSEYPFHSAYYYVGKPNVNNPNRGDTTRIIPRKIGLYDVLDEDNLPAFPGKMITDRVRDIDPQFSYLPNYVAGECYYQLGAKLAIQASLNLVDATYNIIDTLTREDNDEIYYLVEETFLYKKNPNTENIEIKFEIFNGGQWVEYDFFKAGGSCDTYNGRFPPLTTTGELTTGRAVEGTFRYGIGNTSFKAAFGSNTVRLSVRIRDRALHSSNVIVREFELDDIR